MIRDFATGYLPSLQKSCADYLERLSNDPTTKPVVARPAATVMIVRDGEAGLEVFLLRRVPTMRFAPSSMVFPGGGVDARDDADLHWAGPGPVHWAARLGCTEHEARKLVVAAVREVFEECGVLFASRGTKGPLVHASDGSWSHDREALLAREVSLAELLQRHRLVLRSDLLRAHAHWTTPESEGRRYDTRFFVALMPPGQAADGLTTEADHSGWFAPKQVLADFESGHVLLLPPTIVCLEHLAAATSAQQFFAAQPVIRRVMPVAMYDEAGELVLRVDFAGPSPRQPA
ncbi:MAG: NUDIX hydrolase [Dermatophilaceae bacterium]